MRPPGSSATSGSSPPESLTITVPVMLMISSRSFVSPPVNQSAAPDFLRDFQRMLPKIFPSALEAAGLFAAFR